MPFNVIAFTSTLLAFFFGSVFNMLHSSSDEILRHSLTLTHTHCFTVDCS